MKNSILKLFEEKHQKPASQLPDFHPGDTVCVYYKVEETSKAGGAAGTKKYRIQAFEGVVLKLKRGQTDPTFTIRKIGANGIGIERVFPFHSPLIDRIEHKSRGRVRRARLYYLRELSGKAARIRSQQVTSRGS